MTDDDANRAVADLWQGVFGEPPCIEAEPAMVLDILVRCLPPAGPWRPTVQPARPYAAPKAAIRDSLASNGAQSSLVSMAAQSASTSLISISSGSGWENA